MTNEASDEELYEDDDVIEYCRDATPIYDQTEGCDGVLVMQPSGIKCTKCAAWFCF